MITKLFHAQSTSYILEYNYRKIGKGQGTLLHTTLAKEDLNFQKKYFKYITDNPINTGKKIKNIATHFSMSYHPSEKITDQKMVEIAQEYLQKMDYINTDYTIFRHSDTDHEHIHIVASRINYDNRLIKDNNNFKRNLEQCRILEKKHNLYIVDNKAGQQKNYREMLKNKHYLVMALLKDDTNESLEIKQRLTKRLTRNTLNNKSTIAELDNNDLKYFLGNSQYNKYKDYVTTNKIGEISKTAQIEQELTKHIEAYPKQTIDEYLQTLNQNPTIYARRLIGKGNKPYIQYGLKEDSFYTSEKFLNPIFRHENIENTTLGLHKELDIQLNIHDKISSILKTAKNQKDFELGCAMEHIDIKYSKTNNGRDIQGLSFKLSKDDTYIKASDINRKFSWNELQKKFKATATKKAYQR